jgi:hypothetical protein
MFSRRDSCRRSLLPSHSRVLRNRNTLRHTYPPRSSSHGIWRRPGEYISRTARHSYRLLGNHSPARDSKRQRGLPSQHRSRCRSSQHHSLAAPAPSPPTRRPSAADGHHLHAPRSRRRLPMPGRVQHPSPVSSATSSSGLLTIIETPWLTAALQSREPSAPGDQANV